MVPPEFGLHTSFLGIGDWLCRLNPRSGVKREPPAPGLACPHHSPMAPHTLWGHTEPPRAAPEGPCGVTPGSGPSPPTLQGHIPTGRGRPLPNPADWWGQQNHSLKEEMLSGGRTSWASGVPTGPCPPLGLPRAPLVGPSSPHPPGIALGSEALLLSQGFRNPRRTQMLFASPSPPVLGGWQTECLC